MVAASLLLAILIGKPLPAGAAPRSSCSSLTPDAIIALEPREQTVSLGDTFTVKVTIEQVSDLGGYEFKVRYNPSVVEVLDVEVGDFLGSTGCTVIPLGPDLDNETGVVVFAAFSLGCTPGPEGDGELATISLKAVGEGVTDLDLYDVKVLDPSAGQILFTVEDGRVQVGSESMLTPTPMPTATPRETPTAATATGTPVGTATPAATVTGTPGTAVPEATVPATKTPQVGPTQQGTASSPTATPGPMEATAGAPEPTATGTGEVEGGSAATETPSTTPSATSPAALAAESEPTSAGAAGKPAAEPAEEAQAASETGPALIGGAVALAIVGVVAIAVGVSLLVSKRGRR